VAPTRPSSATTTSMQRHSGRIALRITSLGAAGDHRCGTRLGIRKVPKPRVEHSTGVISVCCPSEKPIAEVFAANLEEFDQQLVRIAPTNLDANDSNLMSLATSEFHGHRMRGRRHPPVPASSRRCRSTTTVVLE